jgi:hypothetical protein
MWPRRRAHSCPLQSLSLATSLPFHPAMCQRVSAGRASRCSKARLRAPSHPTVMINTRTSALRVPRVHHRQIHTIPVSLSTIVNCTWAAASCDESLTIMMAGRYVAAARSGPRERDWTRDVEDESASRQTRRARGKRSWRLGARQRGPRREAHDSDHGGLQSAGMKLGAGMRRAPVARGWGRAFSAGPGRKQGDQMHSMQKQGGALSTCASLRPCLPAHSSAGGPVGPPSSPAGRPRHQSDRFGLTALCCPSQWG